MTHICDEFDEELRAIRLASQDGVSWDSASFEERETYRLRACELLIWE